MSKQMARRYEAAWNQTFYERESWEQRIIIEEPHGRHAGELARDAVKLAEDMAVEFQVPTTGVH